MSTQTDLPADEPVIVMTRVYDAPRDLVWKVSTEAEHVRRWWGGQGVTNPVCEMDVRRRRSTTSPARRGGPWSPASPRWPSAKPPSPSASAVIEASNERLEAYLKDQRA